MLMKITMIRNYTPAYERKGNENDKIENNELEIFLISNQKENSNRPVLKSVTTSKIIGKNHPASFFN